MIHRNQKLFQAKDDRDSDSDISNSSGTEDSANDSCTWEVESSEPLPSETEDSIGEEEVTNFTHPLFLGDVRMSSHDTRLKKTHWNIDASTALQYFLVFTPSA